MRNLNKLITAILLIGFPLSFGLLSSFGNISHIHTTEVLNEVEPNESKTESLVGIRRASQNTQRQTVPGNANNMYMCAFSPNLSGWVIKASISSTSKFIKNCSFLL